MDFTYLIALVFALLVGFAGSLLFLAIRGRAYWRLIASTLAVSVIADYALLIDWSRVDQYDTEFVLLDAAFFFGYGVIGCSIGTFPALAARAIYRTVKERELRDSV